MDGSWLVEGVGVSPDIEVDNLPHESFNGRDRQLETALDWLRRGWMPNRCSRCSAVRFRRCRQSESIHDPANHYYPAVCGSSFTLVIPAVQASEDFKTALEELLERDQRHRGAGSGKD